MWFTPSEISYFPFFILKENNQKASADYLKAIYPKPQLCDVIFGFYTGWKVNWFPPWRHQKQWK